MKLLPITILGFMFANEGFGYRGYGEQCTPFIHIPDGQSCDPSKMLECDRNRCKCPDNLQWIYQYDRCGFRVQAQCSEPFGLGVNFGGGFGPGQGVIQGGHLGRYPPCPPNSYCDTQNKFCTCEPYYRPNYDFSACNGAKGNQAKFPFLASLILFLTFTKIINCN